MNQDPELELAPVGSDEQLAVEPIASLTLSFAGVREALAQPHYSHDTGFPGDAETSRVCWRVRDRRSGALLVVWDDRASEPTPAQTASWLVWWQDGPGKRGSGRRVADLLIGTDAGGVIVPL
ncbi:MAG: hypothetical protein KTR15_07790 [Phycisphaeraceae bacterium]|nr:hypothetical protein [Phycisphaeraceae bacterium]